MKSTTTTTSAPRKNRHRHHHRRRRRLKTSVILLGLIGIITCIHLFLSLRWFNNSSSTSNIVFNNNDQLLQVKQQQQSDHNAGKVSNFYYDDSYDPTIFHQNPPSFTFKSTNNQKSICEIQPGTGEEGPAGIKGLYKIQQEIFNDKAKVSSASTATAAEGAGTAAAAAAVVGEKIKLLCMVYTHENRHDIIQAIIETYGSQCDGFIAFSNVTDLSVGAISIPHDGPEEYGNMWMKVRSMWQFVYDQRYVNQYDLFHIGGDDMYVIPNNIKRLVADTVDTVNTVSVSYKTQPLYLGASIPNPQNPKRRFAGGG